MKKAIRKQPRMKSFDRFELQYASTLMLTGRREEAYETILPILYKHPYDVQILQMANDLSFELGDIVTGWITSYRLAELLPDESIGFMNTAIAANQLNLPFTVVYYAELYLQRWGDDSDANEIRQLKTIWEKTCAEIRTHDPVNTARPNEHLSLLERGNLLTRVSEFEEARIACQKAIEIMPDVPAPYNNLGASYAQEGKLTEALEIIRQAVERFPDDFHARCNLAQILVRTGQNSEAQKLAQSLRQNLPPQQEQWEKLIETLSYIGDDAAIISLYNENQKTHKFQTITPLVRHFIAVALARSNNPKEAKKIWKEVVKDAPNLEVAASNLEDLQNRVGEQNGPWVLPFTQWFPVEWIEQIADISTESYNEQAIKRKIERLVRDTLGMETALQIALERGDPQGREFAIRLSAIYPVSGLAEFVQSAKGTDADRVRASEIVVDHGLLPRGVPVKMFQEGKQTELLFLNYEVDGEPDRNQFPKNIQRIYRQSSEAFNNNNFEQALQLAQEALVLAPNHPVLMNQIALCLMQSGKSEEGETVLRQNAEQNPDYLFARCGMAIISVREGKLEEAKQWIAPLLQRSRFHFSEFKMLVHAQVGLLNAAGNLAAAQQWLAMLEETLPDASPLSRIKAKSWLR